MMPHNKGNSAYATKEHFLNEAITKNNIDIAFIREASTTNRYLQNYNLIDGHNCETKPMSSGVDISRNIILINNRSSIYQKARPRKYFHIHYMDRNKNK